MKKFSILLFFLTLCLVGSSWGQLVRAEAFPGLDVGTKVTNAQGACLSGYACVIEISPALGAYPAGSIPTPGASQLFIDYRTPGSVTYTGPSTASTTPDNLTLVGDGTAANPSIAFATAISTGFYKLSSGFAVSIAGNPRFWVLAGQVNISNSAGYTWSSGADASSAGDTGIWRNAAGVVNVANGNTNNANGVVRARRYKASGGTALVVGDFASLSAGWGTTASVSAVTANSTDAAGQVTISSSGTGQAANPTFVLTFKDGTWTNTPFCIAVRNDANAPASGGILTVTASATTQTFQFIGTPVAGSSYVITFQCMGSSGS